MGTAYFHLKLSFVSPRAARMGLKKLSIFLQECDRAYDYWQDKRQKLAPAEFWAYFKVQYPQIHEFQDVFVHAAGGDCDNGLAGTMSFSGPDMDFVLWGCQVIYSVECYNGGDWSPLIEYCKVRLGAVEVEQINDNDYNEEEMLEFIKPDPRDGALSDADF